MAVVVLALAAGAYSCTKSAANQESSTKPTGEVLGTAGSKGPARDSMMGAPGSVGNGSIEAKGGPEANRFRLSADEGRLAIEAPGEAKAGSEMIAKIIVTPGSEYKVNTEFPTKLTLETTSGLTFAKAELKAGGHDKAKGDADVFDEKGLAFIVKLTANASGNYTINGSFKFAVCDKAGHQCLAKKEPIAIQVAAK